MKTTEINQNDASYTTKVIDSDVPIEELLGSVTAYNNVEGSEVRSQLRTSARVFKKMKLDSVIQTQPAASTEKEKKEPIKEEIKQETKKFRPLWAQEDKDLFFEALNEYGKDFEAIHSYIGIKLRKKGLPESQIKSKDQIRHFYYRSWNKISKHLKFSDDIKKPVQELYGLINYGELRKKIGFVTEKTSVKLNELIYRGSVAIRVKGKTLRIRTPMCKALRKLNQLDEKHEDLKLPTRVTIVLQPKDMKTFVKVQEMAQNPRVHIVLPLQKRLSSIIKYMNERWKTKDAKEYEKATNSVNSITSDCLSSEKVAENISLLTPPLRLSPPPDVSISLPSFNLSEYLTSQSICLNAYEERIGVKIRGQELFQILCTSSSKNSSKKGHKRPRNESTSELQNQNQNLKVSPSTKIFEQNEACYMDVDECIDDAVNELLALQNIATSSTNTTTTTKEELITENVDIKNEVNESAEMKVERIRKGWTSLNSENVSIGDLYLMFGSDSRLVLEYSWDSAPIFKKEGKEEEVPSAVELQNNNKLDEEEIEINASLEAEKTPPLSLILKRLLSIAKLHYRKNIVKCPCGHVCGSSGSIVSTPKTATLLKITQQQQNNQCNSNQNSGTKEETMHGESGSNLIRGINLGGENNSNSVLFQSQVNTNLFRRPTSPNTSALHAQIASIRKLKPKYCNRRGRFRRTQHVVVERKLPLLANKADRNSGGRIVQMNIVPQSSSLRQIAPKVIDVTSNVSSAGEINQTLINTEYVNGGTVSVIDLNQLQQGVQESFTLLTSSTSSVVSREETCLNNQNKEEPIIISDNATTPSRIGSPTSISNLLDMALSATPNSSNDVKNGANISFAGFLGTENSASTPPSSPSRILKENDNQWLNSEVGDFSLSSFLGHLESPMKTNSVALQPDDSRLGLSQDVDQQLQSMLTESSLDYTAKFADLAAQVTDLKK